MRDDPSNSPLAIALSAAVPLRIAEYRAYGGPKPADFDRAREFAGTLGERGDILLFRSSKKGETEEMFNRLADALAVMAFCPGGFKFCGTHYEAKADESDV